jgi:hypothetical protein
MDDRTHVQIVAEYQQKKPDLDLELEKARALYQTICTSPDGVREMMLVLLRTRNEAIDFAIAAAHDIVPGNWTLANCLEAAKTPINLTRSL